MENTNLLIPYQNKKIRQLYKNLKKSIYLCDKIILLNIDLLGGSYQDDCRNFFNLLLSRNNTIDQTRDYLINDDILYFVENLDEFDENLVDPLNKLNNSNLEIVQKMIGLDREISWVEFQKICEEINYNNKSSNQKLKIIKEYVSKSKELLEKYNKKFEEGHLLIKPECKDSSGKNCFSKIKDTIDSINLKLNLDLN